MVDRNILTRATDRRILSALDPVGLFLTEGFHLLGLFAIGGRRSGRRRRRFTG